MEQLPTEILLCILSKLDWKSTVCLLKVSKRLYQVVFPSIYRSLHIRLDAKDVVAARQRLHDINLRHVQYTKHISLNVPYILHAWNRVIRCDPDDDRLMASPRSPLPDVPKFRCDLLVNSIDDNCLRSFSWNVGMNCPDVIDLDGIWSALGRKSRLNAISIITLHGCELDRIEPISPVHLPALESFTWKSPSSCYGFRWMRDCIAIHRKQLTTLIIGVFDWHTSMEGWAERSETPSTDRNFLANDILGIEPGREASHNLLPRLETLSLTRVSFSSYTRQMSSCLNISHLISLELWECRYALDLLLCVVESQQPTRLRKFTFSSINSANLEPNEVEAGSHSLSSFLLSFKGLDTIRLRLPWYTDPKRCVWEGLLNHSATLKYLTVQGEIEYNLAMNPEIFTLCRSPSLIGFGINAQPGELLRIWTTQSEKPTFKALHITPLRKLTRRQRWNEYGSVRPYVPWIFGPDGLRTLFTLAIENTVFFRNSKRRRNFTQQEGDNDYILWDLEDYTDPDSSVYHN
ncbi:putative cyclin-like F-box [Rosellinia necatrix]|uniref:Putative cyclin-like F-box n=1 Tax=Rosellinia necatrix TaxID=77044 RepID=A0A1S8A9Y3_ROSNE|nr:putative cyclin-like F-box [Rosellinia necatrix]